MKTIKTDACAPKGETEGVLASNPALEFVLALARHRAYLDHENQKLTTPRVMASKSMDSEAIDCHITVVDGEPAVANQEVLP